MVMCTAPSLHPLKADRLVVSPSLKQSSMDRPWYSSDERVDDSMSSTSAVAPLKLTSVWAGRSGGVYGLGVRVSWVLDGSDKLERRARVGRHRLAILHQSGSPRVLWRFGNLDSESLEEAIKIWLLFYLVYHFLCYMLSRQAFFLN